MFQPVVVVTWLVASSLTAMSSTAKRPPAEREPDPCTHWQGTVSGNDPSVRVTAILCPGPNQRVTGTLVWESSRSGTNTRTLEGTQAGKTFTLRDVAIAGHANPGWQFCKIDRYTLTLANNDTRLAGTYHSSACSDDATVTLERVR